MNKIRTVVAAVDFSENSKSALGMALDLAKQNSARLLVVHAIDRHLVSDLAKAIKVSVEEMVQHITGQCRDRFAAWVADLPDGSSVELTVLAGVPLDSLLKFAMEHKADLVVAGVTGDGHHHSLGSIALRLARQVPSKVLLVRGLETPRIEKVVAAIDFSEMSAEVLRQAARVAQLYDAKVTVVHSFDPPWKKLHYMAPTPQARPEYIEAYRKTLQDELESLVTACDEFAKETEVRLSLREESTAWEGTCEEAQEQDADLVIIGTRGRSRLRYVLLGSTTEHVLEHTDASVLAVKPADFHSPAE